MAETIRDGPFVNVAVFCEKVLSEKSEMQSVIRILDRFMVNAPPNSPEVMPPVTIQATLFIILKSGGAKGRQTLVLRPESPSGGKLPEAEFPVLFEGDDRGVAITLETAIQATEEGLYWFDLWLSGSRLTRVPLRILYQRIRTGS